MFHFYSPCKRQETTPEVLRNYTEKTSGNYTVRKRQETTTSGKYITVRQLQRRETTPEVFYKKGVLKDKVKFSGKHLCWSLFLIKFIEKETPAQLVSCKFCQIFKNTFLQNTSGRLLLKTRRM